MDFLDIQYEPERFLYAAVGDVHGNLGSLTAAVDIVRAPGDTLFIGPVKARCLVSFGA